MNWEQISRIQLLINRNQFDHARDSALRMLSDNPNDADVYDLLAQIAINTGDNLEGLRHLEQAIGLDPENEHYYYNKSVAHLNLDQYKKAERAIDTALQMNSDQASFFGIKAAIYLHQNKFKQAQQFAAKGLEIDPDEDYCNNILALAKGRSGDPDGAIERFNKMLEDNPENSMALANTGYQYLHKGKVKEAKRYFGDALRLDPNSEYIRHGMLEAMKSSNFFYRTILRYSLWISSLSDHRWIVILGFLIIVNVLPFLLPVYLIFVFWTWFAVPLSDVIFYFDKDAKYLMTESSRKIARVNTGLLVLTALALTAGIFINTGFLILAAGLFISLLPISRLDASLKKYYQILMLFFAVVFIGAGIAAPLLASYEDFRLIPLTVLTFGAVIFTWMVALIRD